MEIAMEMREGNLFGSILLFSLPLMVTNMFQLLFNTADVAIVGKFAGPLSLGAVGSTTLLVTLTTGWLMGMGGGVNTVVAYHIGADDKERETEARSTGFVLCLLTGFLTLLTGFAGAEGILRLLGTKEELLLEAILYFRIYMLGSPALALFNYGNAVLSAEGETRKPLLYLTVSGIINVILNLLFVAVFHRRVDGVALASILAQYLSAALILRELKRREEKVPAGGQRSLSLEMAVRILKIGGPFAIQYSMFALANLFVQSAVNSFDHVVVEGNSAAMNFDFIVYEMMAAFYVACTSFSAQNYGAGKKERVRDTYLITLFYSFAVGLLMGLLLFAVRTPLLYLFTDDPEVVKYGAIRLGIMAFTYWVSAFMDNATAAARGLGKTMIPTVIILMGSIVFRILWVLTIFRHFHTLFSLYILYACAFAVTALFGNLYYILLYRKTFREE